MLTAFSYSFSTTPLQYFFQLLRKNPKHRLGTGDQDAEEVKKEMYFVVSNEHNDWEMT